MGQGRILKNVHKTFSDVGRFLVRWWSWQYCSCLDSCLYDLVFVKRRVTCVYLSIYLWICESSKSNLKISKTLMIYSLQMILSSNPRTAIICAIEEYHTGLGTAASGLHEVTVDSILFLLGQNWNESKRWEYGPKKLQEQLMPWACPACASLCPLGPSIVSMYPAFRNQTKAKIRSTL